MEAELLRVEEVAELGRAIVIAPENVAKDLREFVGEDVVGGIFPGVIFDGKVYNDRVVAVRCDFEVYRGSSAANAKGRTLLTILDGWSERAESLLEDVYAKLGNSVTYFGGGAGSLNGKIDCLFIGKEFFRDDAVFVALRESFDVAIRHGWIATERTFFANRTSGRKIIELDWEPAFDVYASTLHELGAELRRENFLDVAKAYPFSITRARGEDIVRDPIAVEGDEIVCAGRVAEGSLLRLMRGDKESLIRAAEFCAEELGCVEITLDCVSRVLYLGEDFRREAKFMRGSFGALTIGEVACVRGYPIFHNKTVVMGCRRTNS
ncbi:MAG: FIST N-terminal domain-containing protein [Archaeoglobaceae archaeon]